MVDPIPVRVDPESPDGLGETAGEPSIVQPDPSHAVSPVTATIIFHNQDGRNTLVLGSEIMLGDLKALIAVYNTINGTKVKLA